MYAFIMIKCFPLASEALGMHGCMFMFAGCAFTGAMFVILVLPETKGKSFDDIMRMLES